MWTGRISSQTQEHPGRQDVFRVLLSRLVEEGSGSSWVHFEVIADGGWLKNLLSGREPWIEVGYVNGQSLQLNPGVAQSKHSMPNIPEKWRPERKGQFSVPTADVAELAVWIDECLAVVSGDTNYRVSGWMEGF